MLLSGDCTSEECSQKPVCRHYGREKYVPCPIEEIPDDSTVVCTPEYYANLAEVLSIAKTIPCKILYYEPNDNKTLMIKLY